jgi:trans-aconitate 2-methyltransferase
VWDPQQYLRFDEERARPFGELLARVRARRPRFVVDLGCGPATLTGQLAQRWPHAHVVGVDSSAEMVRQAQERAVPGRLDIVLADLSSWGSVRPVDVLVSNAALQWVPDHIVLLGRLVGMLAPHGWLAFQVPGNFGAPGHALLRRRMSSATWRDRLGPVVEKLPSSREPQEYLHRLSSLGCTADVWETTYLHVLPGEDAVLQWMRGTGLRPVLAALTDETEQQDFVAEYAADLREAYPATDIGTVLPFRRIFAVATPLS